MNQRSISANYFDGRSARAHALELSVDAGQIRLRGALEKTYPAQTTRLAEAFLRAPTVLTFADGARCEIIGSEPGEWLRKALGYRSPRAMRLAMHPLLVLPVLVLLLAGLLVALTLLVMRYAPGLPAARVPIAVSTTDDMLVLALQRSRVIEASRLSDEWLNKVNHTVRDIAPAGQRLRVMVRNSRTLGANALTLPDGSIIITDQMVRAIVGKQGTFGIQQKALLTTLLAHQIGHLRLQHPAHLLPRSDLTMPERIDYARLFDEEEIASNITQQPYPAALESAAQTETLVLMASNPPLMLPLEALRQQLAASGAKADAYLLTHANGAEADR